MKRFLAGLLAALALVSVCPQPLAAPTDALTVVQTVQLLGIITGDEQGNLNLGNSVTRAQFAKMMVAASTYKDTVGTAAGVSPFKDVTYRHWAAGYVKIAVDAGWINGYTDGTYRPDNTITLEEAATALLRMLGYSSADLTGVYPAAQLSKYRSVGLGDNMTATQGQLLKRSDCAQLFYNLLETKNKEGQFYGTTLGYALNAAGQLDYVTLIGTNMKGPYVAETAALALPFDAASAKYYRNGSLTSGADVAAYDVYYYNENLRTVWVYNNKVTGTYTAATPGTASPTSVTVAGNSYTVASGTAQYQLSDMGEYSIGDTVTLLLGINGQVAGVQSAQNTTGQHYGIVTSVQSQTYQNNAGQSTTRTMANVACTDGVTRQFDCGSAKFKAGDMIYASYENGSVVARGLSGKSLTGTVSTNGKTVGDYTFASGVQIMDANELGAAKVIYTDRLAGSQLKSGDVRFYALDSSGKISHMILDDATGDLGSYGIILSADEVDQSIGGEWLLQGTYKYLLDGVESVISGSKIYNISSGPTQFNYNSNKEIQTMKNLPMVNISSLSQLTAMAGNQKYQLADNVQVYIRDGSKYNASNVSAVSSGYNLRGYYDQNGSVGGRIRIIIASK